MNYSMLPSSLSALLLLFSLVLVVVPMMTVTVVRVESFVLPATTTTCTTTATRTNNIVFRDDPTTTRSRSRSRSRSTPPLYASTTPTIDSSSSSSSSNNNENDVDDANDTILQQIDEAKKILYRAADTKKEDADVVVDALLTLEKLSRKANKADPTRSEKTLSALASNADGDGDGVSWRLIFTTGTIDTQRKLGGTKINYFPLKATQSFDKSQDPWLIQNGIYLGDEFALVKFEGDFDWTFTEKTGLTKVTFDFSRIQLFNGLFDIPLKKGEAASLGAKSGLGSENNIKLNKKGKRAFFNWISADDRIATARGGGGGIALWKRI